MQSSSSSINQSRQSLLQFFNDQYLFVCEFINKKVAVCNNKIKVIKNEMKCFDNDDYDDGNKQVSKKKFK